jgi:hypothetical protein
MGTPMLITQLYKVTIAFLISAVIWILYYSMPISFFVDPHTVLFIAVVLVYLLLFGFIFDSFFVLLLTGGFIYWTTFIFLLVSRYDDFVFWHITFVKSIAQTLLSQVGLGILLSSVILLVLKYIKLRFLFIDTQIEKISHRKVFIMVSIFLLFAAGMSVVLIGQAYSITPKHIISAIQNQKISTKVEKILETSPEQALELYLSSLESSDYDKAYYAQSANSLSDNDEQAYYDFIDKAKEEDIQLSKPVQHLVKKDQGSTDESTFLVTILRESQTSQEYKFIVVKGQDKWYIKERTLLKIN